MTLILLLEWFMLESESIHFTGPPNFTGGSWSMSKALSLPWAGSGLFTLSLQHRLTACHPKETAKPPFRSRNWTEASRKPSEHPILTRRRDAAMEPGPRDATGAGKVDESFQAGGIT